MTKEVNKVFRTKDYSIFNVHRMNRTIIPTHVRTMKRLISENGWERGSYIIIDKKGNVIDGQHRLMAAMELGSEVDYIIEKSATIGSMSKLNQGQKGWNIITHLEHNVKLGHQDYILLDRFMKNFPQLRPTECTMLVKNNNSSAERGSFERGDFKVSDMKVAYKWGHQIMKLRYIFDGYNKSIFVRAMIKVLQRPNFSFDEFLHKVNLRKSMIHMCGTVDDYVEMIERIYNYKRKDKENLRF
jgi:hypothetical protein